MNRDRDEQRRWAWWATFASAATLTLLGYTAASQALEPARDRDLEVVAAEGDASPAPEARVRELLGLRDVGTATAEMGPLIAEQFALTLEEDNPEVADGVAESFRQALLDVLSRDLDDAESRLWRSYVDLYQRNFSAAEIDDLITFYQSTTGRKFLAQQQLLFEESGLVMQAWVYGAKERVILRFEELMALRSAEQG